MTLQTTEITVPELPTLHPLPAGSSELCDGEAGGGTSALIRVVFPSGRELLLCGHHARPLGFDPKTHKTYLSEENKAQGSDH